MARIKGTSEFPVNFEPTGQSPFDARLLVPKKEDLYTAYPNNNYYPNMVVTVQEENAQYMLVDTSKRTAPEGWLKLGSDTENGIKVYQNGSRIMEVALGTTAANSSIKFGEEGGNNVGYYANFSKGHILLYNYGPILKSICDNSGYGYYVRLGGSSTRYTSDTESKIITCHKGMYSNEYDLPTEYQNAWVYYGYDGSEFAVCKDGSNKITIPQNTFGDTDAVNKKYADTGTLLTNENLFTLGPGLYWADHNNSCTNKPGDVNAFQLKVEKIGVNNLYLELIAGGHHANVEVGDTYYTRCQEGSLNSDGTYLMKYDAWTKLDKKNPDLSSYVQSSTLSSYAKKTDLNSYLNAATGTYIKDILQDIYYERNTTLDFSDPNWSINEIVTTTVNSINVHDLEYDGVYANILVGDGIIIKEGALYNGSSGTRPIKCEILTDPSLHLIVESDINAISNTENIIHTRIEGDRQITIFERPSDGVLILNYTRWFKIYAMYVGSGKHNSIYKVLPNDNKELVYKDENVDLTNYLPLTGGAMKDESSIFFTYGENIGAEINARLIYMSYASDPTKPLYGNSIYWNVDGFMALTVIEGDNTEYSALLYADEGENGTQYAPRYTLDLKGDMSHSYLSPYILNFEYNSIKTIYGSDSINITKNLNLKTCADHPDYTGTGMSIDLIEDFYISFGNIMKENGHAIINAKGFRNIENDQNKVYTTDGGTAELPKYKITTQSEYDALTPKDEDTVYFIKSDNPINLTYTE